MTASPRPPRRSWTGVVRFGALAALFAAAPAAAQQVFLESLWVHSPLNSCVTLQSGASLQLSCSDSNTKRPINGNISNNPHIEFDQDIGAQNTQCVTTGSIPPGSLTNNICNSKVALCTRVGYSNEQTGATPFGLDFVSFEIFKFQQGSNPLDAQSTPPLRTFFIDNPGQIPAGTNSTAVPIEPFCVVWDGSINIQGEFGKSNGQYGFRATVATNQTGASGNINITQTRAFPGGFTRDTGDNLVDERPITVDVTNVHVVRASPTVVGDITGVAAQPYNLTYRLAKDATMFLTITDSASNQLIRNVVPGQPRVGEGIPSGTLQNGDSWNGRHENGGLMPPGVYLATLQSFARDQYGNDLSAAVTRQIALDTLQITDIRVQPLTDSSTALAVLSYVLTEPATVYIEIYPPGTAFTTLNNVNTLGDLNPDTNGGVHKNFGATLGGAPVSPVRHIQEQKDFRRSVINFWDGRDSNGNVMPDGDYVFVIYAALPSPNGFPFRGVVTDKRIWSSNARSGFLTVTRGFVTVSQVGPASTVIGSSPPVAGLDPFTFSYSLSREAFVTLKIFNANGNTLVKTLVNGEVRPGNFLNRERWLIPTGDDGLWVSSGTYLAQLTAADSFFPVKVTTTTALFFINPFRITDVLTSPLLTAATDVLTMSYQLSQPMQVAWNIYPPGTVISGAASTWPPCGSLEPGNCAQVTTNGTPTRPLITIKGMRPGRLRITEFWDGRDAEGLFVPDGNYVFVLAAQSTTTPRYFATDQIVGNITVARGSIVFPIFNVTPTFPTLFNSSQTISLPPYEVDYSMTRQSSVTITILKQSTPPTVVKTLVAGQVRDASILNKEFWDGRNDQGSFVDPGFYLVRIVAEDLSSSLSSGSTAQMTISVNPLRIYDVAISPLRPDFGSALIAYQVSETMKASIKIYRPGTTFDPNGNPTPPESKSLIKRIVGVRPARSEVSEIWDGTDFTLAPVPDGNYLFKIIASTDLTAIDGAGNLKVGAPLAEDLIISEVPVVRGDSADPINEFVSARNTFIFPNPMSGPSGTFRIYVPFEGRVKLKIYNIAGDLVWSFDTPKISGPSAGTGDCQTFDSSGATSSVSHGGCAIINWPKTNAHGRPLAHGTYITLIQFEASRGESSIIQTFRKFLIP